MTRTRNSKGNGEVNRNASPERPGYAGRAYGVVGTPVSYADVSPNALLEAICAITDAGDAIMFSRSSDGGVFSLRVYSGKASYPYYPKDASALEELLDYLVKVAGT